MVSDTVTLDETRVREANDVTIPVPDELLETVHVTSGMKALVLVSTGTHSALFETPVLNTSNPHIAVPDNVLDIDVFIEQQLTYWVTIPEKFADIDLVDGTISFEDEITGTPLDPTGGTWLLISDGEFGYSQAADRMKGEITIYKDPYREFLDYTDDDTFTVKCTHNDTAIESTVNVYNNKKGFNISKPDRNKLGVSKDDRSVTVWIDTQSIVDDDSNATDSTTHNGESQQTKNREQTTSDLITEDNTVQTEESRSNEESSVTTHDACSTDNNDIEVNRRQLMDQLDTDMDVEPDVNPDLVPVVLLDEDERTREDWQAHYLTEDEELLCGKSYTEYVKDPKQTHYTDVCHDCALAQPGAVPEGDLVILLEKLTGLSFTTEFPLVLDRRDAALLIARFTMETSNEEFAFLEEYAAEHEVSIIEAYDSIITAGIESIKKKQNR